MAVVCYTGPEALKNRSANRFAAWPKPWPGKRLGNVANPHISPSFALEPDEKIFTIGSCFARNIEIHLERFGFALPMRQLELPNLTQVDQQRSFLNKYVPHSMLNEIRWALVPEASYPVDALLETGDDLWCDPHLNILEPEPRELVLARRRAMTAAVAEAASCRVVIMTMGLVEAWWDKQTSLYLNGTPHRWARDHYPDRFEVHVLSYEEINETLEAIYSLLREYGHPEFRMLITVSPVPLLATWTETDVLIANTYSKSVLRAATENFSRSHENVDYFPSYESIMLTNSTRAWESDGRHVTAGAVGINIGRMMRAYLEPSPEVDRYCRLQESRAQAFSVPTGAGNGVVDVDWLAGPILVLDGRRHPGRQPLPGILGDIPAQNLFLCSVTPSSVDRPRQAGLPAGLRRTLSLAQAASRSYHAVVLLGDDHAAPSTTHVLLARGYRSKAGHFICDSRACEPLAVKRRLLERV